MASLIVNDNQDRFNQQVGALCGVEYGLVLLMCRFDMV